ncbi:adenylosuccinate synthase [bacterium]|nr:adenylosuccinate synthase [bacterium]
MSNIAVIGTQWGDEGKGKIIDLLAERFDIIARFQGGHNAGHTVCLGNQKYILHLIPTGILHPEKICVIGNGVVVDITALINEIEELKKKGVVINDNLLISQRAHIIMPYHRLMDRYREEARGAKRIGTTGRGIGPAYENKMARSGICAGDLMNEKVLIDKVAANIEEINHVLEKVYSQPRIDPGAIEAEILEQAESVKGYITDTSLFINNALDHGKSLLMEGAQGTMLDIDHGTYPYVTSSNCVASNACTGLGIGISRVDGVMGVIKAYTTRVGNGPFPTELTDKSGQILQEKGNEYGATTGRRRRCGWFDGVVARYAIRINGVHTLALTKLDVMDTLAKINVCQGYKWKGKIFSDLPYDPTVLAEGEPVYKELDGWLASTSDLTEYNRLPQKAKDYIKYIEDMFETPICLISTGSEREKTIWVKGSPLDNWLMIP